MSVLSYINQLFNRRRRMKSVTTVVRRFSRQTFPQDMPVWSMVAEDHTTECVVYMTYERGETTTVLSPHRFFKVKLPDMSVTALQENYYPAQWGPYH